MNKLVSIDGDFFFSQRVLQKLCVAALRNNRLAEVKAVAMEAKFNESQFDSSVMNACQEEKNVAWARAYFDLVERQQKRECSIFMLTQYLSILELSEEVGFDTSAHAHLCMMTDGLLPEEQCDGCYSPYI